MNTPPFLAELFRCPVGDLIVRPVTGGCIHTAYCVKVRDQVWFVKSNDLSAVDAFRAEADSLKHLAEVSADIKGLLVPVAEQVTVLGTSAWLVLPWIEPGEGASNDAAFSHFGRCLAKMHRQTLQHETQPQETQPDQRQRACIGWHQDNYLGRTKQPNHPEGWEGTWPEFFAHHRIEFQIRQAADRGLADRTLVSDCEKLIKRMPEILAGRKEQTSLLHGDLWSGNYFWDNQGSVVLIDPASYRGCREAEWGMIRLFGSCPPAFEQAYQDEFPLVDGWQRRVSVYVLYHLLNHLNLFGTGYLSQCQGLAREIVTE